MESHMIYQFPMADIKTITNSVPASNINILSYSLFISLAVSSYSFFISFYYLTRFQFLDAASLGSWPLPQSSKPGE